RKARSFHVVDGGGYQPSGGIVLKKTDGLANDPRVDLIAQIGNGSETGILYRSGPDILGESLGEEENDQGESKNSPNVVNARREIIVQVENATAPRNRSYGQARTRSRGIEDEVHGQLDHQGHGAFGKRDKRDQDDSQTEPQSVRPQVSEQ